MDKNVLRLLYTLAWSMSGLNCRYLNPYIKLKLIERQLSNFEIKLNCQIFYNFSMWASETPFQSYNSKQILFFPYLIWPPVSRIKALKNFSAICHIQFQRKVTAYFQLKKFGLKKMMWTQKNYSWSKSICKYKFCKHRLDYILLKGEGNEESPFDL